MLWPILNGDWQGLAVNVREIIKILEADGWFLVRTRGSHRQYHHPTKLGTTTVAGHAKIDIPPKTLKSILRQAGLFETESETE
jgi:predicted RNA binding protein YcfA (HicA-like mRNA interferase family)